MRIRETNVYEKWFRRLKDCDAKARINARLRRISLAGRLVGDFKSVGDGVIELRFDVGPGYRVYVAERGGALLLLLIGGDKSSQQSDIERAKVMLRELEA